MFNHLRVTTDWDSLVQSIEVVIIEGQPHGKALDDEGGQIFAVTPPLLFGVTLYKFLVDISTDQANGLLLQILRLSSYLFPLLVDLGLRVLWRHYTPHLIKGIHIKRHGV